MFVPLSATRGAPVGTPVTVNRNGQLQVLTLGERQGGTVAGNATVVGVSDGAPVIERIGGTGTLAAPGAAVVTGTSAGGSNVTTQRAAVGTGLSRRQRAAIERARAAEGTPAATPAATPAR